MRERAIDIGELDALDDDGAYTAERPLRSTFLIRLIAGNLREWLVLAAITISVGAVLINALFLQSGPHPAPIFSNRSAPAPSRNDHAMALPRPRPPELNVNLPMPTRTNTEIIADIQRELAQRGFYDGPTDGVYSPNTDIAIRDFEHTASLRPSTEPNESLRRTIARSAVKAAATDTRDPIASLIAPSKRVVAVQRALADYGFGQIRASGQYDPPTRAAIEEFERNRKLPVTGRISMRLTRELAAVTGRPLE